MANSDLHSRKENSFSTNCLSGNRIQDLDMFQKRPRYWTSFCAQLYILDWDNSIVDSDWASKNKTDDFWLELSDFLFIQSL